MSEYDTPFQSGPWQGFYVYGAGRDQARHRQDLRLEFAEGKIKGTGLDDIGPFSVSGRYDVDGGRCSWTKVYMHRPMAAVFYSGVGEPEPVIYGAWALPNGDRGGFKLWPGGTGGLEGVGAREEADVPAARAAGLIDEYA
ncbi:MAG: hypothetical protein JXR37_33130 [Kiritimatiellae bacterium]|nr:hypothetical protein [Kiritimatiellia bacterium]